MTTEKMDSFHQRIEDLIHDLEYVQEKLEDGEPDVAYEELSCQSGTIQTLLNDMREVL